MLILEKGIDLIVFGIHKTDQGTQRRKTVDQCLLTRQKLNRVLAFRLLILNCPFVYELFNLYLEPGINGYKFQDPGQIKIVFP